MKNFIVGKYLTCRDMNDFSIIVHHDYRLSV